MIESPLRSTRDAARDHATADVAFADDSVFALLRENIPASYRPAPAEGCPSGARSLTFL